MSTQDKSYFIGGRLYHEGDMVTGTSATSGELHCRASTVKIANIHVAMAIKVQESEGKYHDI